MTRVLPGLPPYGPPALSFPRQNAFQEGFVVEFIADKGEAWVANFAKLSPDGICAIYPELGPRSIFVLAGGTGYIVDSEERELIREIEGPIDQCWYQSELHAMVFSNGLRFECFDGHQTLWHSPRVSWDGIRNINCSGMIVSAEAYDPFSDSWLPLQLNLNDGEISGGSYPAGTPVAFST